MQKKKKTFSFFNIGTGKKTFNLIFTPAISKMPLSMK